ncbi:MAG TPA: FxsA family protein [Nocardioidaceae bacterium]|jgi:UPF0716 protein FxsA|nr:FxsA family protein [Nocardioidaceae bacterium]
MSMRTGTTRRRVPWWLLVVLFVVMPLAEIYVLIQVGQVIGAWWVILLLIADSVLGSYLLKREGGRAWGALREALRAGQLPTNQLADGALVLVGGTLLLTPGFITDVFGFFFILPVTRPLARRLLLRFATQRFLRSAQVWSGTGTRQRPGPDSVVRGDVVD